jgi:nicotinate-nucleotide adenylyltransferase
LTNQLPAPLRLGVYGGAFDPPHHAHHALASQLIHQLQLDRLVILPTGHAWHKNRPLSAAEHRLAMAQLAFADLAAVSVDARETQRTGPTYTVDTLAQLQAQFPGAQLFLAMGQDQFAAFASWHRWQDIAQIATICIANRAINTWTTALNKPPDEVLAGCKICSIDMTDMPISATDIRQRVNTGQNIGHLVKPVVAKYIANHSLYVT